VKALRDTYAKLAQRVKIQPFIVIQKLLHGITEDHHTLVASKHSTFHEKYSDANAIDSVVLFKLFNDILNELRTDETLLAAASVKNQQQNPSKNQNQQNSNHAGNANNNSEFLLLKNIPPKTTTPWKWVLEWINGAN